MDVEVSTRGSVAPDLAQLAAEKVGALDAVVQRPLTDARVVLLEKQNPRIPRSARAEGDVRMSGRTIRARVDAETMEQAVDALAERLQQQLRRHIDRLETRSRVPADVAPGQWRRGAWTPPRPPRSWRAASEREVVRRKSFALEPMSAAEAAADMAALDHDFFLFRDADTGADSVIYRRDDDRLAVIAPQDAPEVSGDDRPIREPSRYSGPLDLADALSKMDALNHRFLYFTDASTGRGAVLYLRYDGHYGLIQPAVLRLDRSAARHRSLLAVSWSLRSGRGRRDGAVRRRAYFEVEDRGRQVQRRARVGNVDNAAEVTGPAARRSR